MTQSNSMASHRLKTGMIAGFLTLSVAMTVAPAAQAKAMEDEASAAVSEAVDRTVSALEDSTISSAEADSILELVNVERVAQFSLGNHWADLTEDQKTRYLAAFDTYANAQLQEHLSGFSQADVEIGDVSSRGDDDAIVQTQVNANGERQTVSWRVMKDGDWSVVDIEVQGVWFAIEQRAQFDAVLDKNGGDIDALITKISS